MFLPAKLKANPGLHNWGAKANVANAIVTQEYSGQDAGRKQSAVESFALTYDFCDDAELPPGR